MLSKNARITFEFESQTINTTWKYSKIEILSFNAEEGKVTFSAKSDNVNDIYKYIDKRLAEEIFMNVDHTGYTYDESEKMYDIHVDCTLAESVGRSE